VAFLDSDDLWRPEKLARQLAALRATGAAVCHTRFEVVDARGRRPAWPRFETLRAPARIGLAVFPRLSTCLVKRSVFRQVGVFDAAFRVTNDDTDLFYRIRRRLGARAFHYLDEPLVLYRFEKRRWREIIALKKSFGARRRGRRWRRWQVERVLDGLCFLRKYGRAAGRTLPPPRERIDWSRLFR